MQRFMQAAVSYVTNTSIFFVHFYVQTTMVWCIAQSSCSLQGENRGPLEQAFTTSMQVRRSTHIDKLATEAYDSYIAVAALYGCSNRAITSKSTVQTNFSHFALAVISPYFSNICQERV